MKQAVRPKKRLGQNFLTDKNVLKKIIHACACKADDAVLEVGAGTGELTSLLAGQVRRVYALEIDASLCELLRARFKGQDAVRVIHADILKFDLRSIQENRLKKITVVGNIPYYITTPILERIFSFRDSVETAFFTVQKEFAERVVAPPGSKVYGSLSCFAQYHGKPEILFTIKRRSFFPAPGVDSAFLRLDIHSGPGPHVRDEALLFKVIRASFNQRRKTMKNSLRGIVEPTRLEQFFDAYHIEKNTRPEDLSLKDFINLSNLARGG